MKGVQTGMADRQILVIDDEQNIRRMLAGILEDEDYGVETVSSAEEAAERIEQIDPDLVLLDVQLPGMDGISYLKQMAGRSRMPGVIIMSGHATIDMAVQATRLGAFDFLEKPIDPERLLLTVRHAFEIRALRNENRVLREASSSVWELVGSTPSMESLRSEVGRAAPSHGRVLIFGENGTGKELVARAVHMASDRSRKPFIRVNCAAIPKDLIESELFGHEKGAFTGATQQRIGKIEQAEGGTLLLDEVGDMALETQAKLLRVLEARELERVGGRKTISFDVRVLSATNKDLQKEIADGAFREDLYYRLAVIPITVPPLRDRSDDIPLLVKHFSERFSEESGRSPREFSSDAMDSLRTHQWPGNVRELKNAVERLQIMSRGEVITLSDVRPVIGTSRPTGQVGGSFRERVERFEFDLLLDALRRNGGNVAETARELETDRANLHRKMKRFGINPRELDG